MICCHYTDRERCRAEATHHIDDPNGKPVPGGWTCLPHGTAVVEEYWEKLGQRWTLRPLEAGEG
jgi:hypothetical protein